MLKGFYCIPWLCEQFKDNNYIFMVPTILLGWDLDVQQGLFKLTMKSNDVQAMAEVVVIASNKANPIIDNPFTHFVVSDPCILTLVSFFIEYLQLEEKLPWFMFLGSWKMNATLVLFHS
jgi:hypothetical protein